METTCFGAGLDALVQTAWGWPVGAVVHTVMVMNPSHRTTPELTPIEVKGGVPLGHDIKGKLVFGKRKTDRRAVITLAQYREAIAKATQP